MRRVITIVVAVLVVACIAGVVFVLPQQLRQNAAGGAGGGQRAGQAAVRRVTVQKGSLTLTVSATGSVVAKQQANLSFDQAGRVQEVLVQQDQQVKAGQILARQDDAAQKSNLAQAEYNLKAADAALQKLLRPVDPAAISNAEANVKAAEAAYSSQAGSVNSNTVKAAQLAYNQAIAGAQTAEQQRIAAGGQFANDDPNYQKYIAALGQAQMNAQITQLKLQQAQRGTSLSKATTNITYQQALLAQVKAGPKQSDIDAAQAAYYVVKVQRDQAQHDLDNTQLVAPFAGVVSTISVKQGEVSSGAAMVLTDTSEMYVDISVDEADIGKIHPGQVVDVTFDALPGIPATSKVQRIAQTADTTVAVIMYPVRVILDPNKAALKVGMTANAVFHVQDIQSALRVPNEYLRLNRTTNQYTVNLVARDGTITQVPVEIGLQGSDYSEVLGGLNEGEVIALITTNGTTPGGGNQGGGGGPVIPGGGALGGH